MIYKQCNYTHRPQFIINTYTTLVILHLKKQQKQSKAIIDLLKIVRGKEIYVSYKYKPIYVSF